jgi:hypothetical protein
VSSFVWSAFRPATPRRESLRLTWRRRIRSQAGGDKRILPENHRERQEGQPVGGNDPEETWRVFLYSFQPFRRPTLRRVRHLFVPQSAGVLAMTEARPRA